MIVGLGLGHDGLYFVPIFPDESGESSVYKVTHDPEQPHPINLDPQDPQSLIVKYGCRGCHWLAGSGSNVAPSLDTTQLAPRILSRLKSERYRQSVADLPATHRARYPLSGKAVRQILKLEELDRVRAWVTQQIAQPGFDRVQSQMPDLGVSEEEAKVISDYLVTEEPSGLARIGVWLGRRIGPLRWRHVVYAYAAGTIMTALAVALLAALWRTHNRTTRSRPE
jgi:hypothetical protein